MEPKSTNSVIDNSPKSDIIKKVRNKVLDTSLVVFSLASVPALLVIMARAKDLGWQPAMTWQIIIILILWCTTLFRHSISFQLRVYILLSSLFLLGIVGFWTFGLIGAGIYFFFTANVLSTILFGARWGWITLCVTLITMLSIAIAVLKGSIEFGFDMNAYAVNPSSLLGAILIITLFLSVITSILAEVHTSLIEIIKESNTRARDLAVEIIDRQNAEKEKQNTEDKFQRIVENIKDVYYETGLDGSIFYCSPSGSDLSGYSQEELIGNNASILYNDPKDRDLLLDPLREGGKVRDLELVFKKKNGELYDVSFNADFSTDEHGNPTGLFGTIRDITATKKIKEQIFRAKKMEAVGLMAGGVAHDLNNILSGIVSYPDLLLFKLPANSTLRKPIETIRDSGRRASLVVADLLTVAKGAASSKETHDLHNLIKEYLNSADHEKLKDTFPRVTFESKLKSSHPFLLCSAIHINKCLMNLVHNAVEAIAEDGSICISTSDHKIDEPFSVEHGIKIGDYIVLSVSDTGPGISNKDERHIFEPFYTKKIMGRKGTGLGLTIVWNAVQNHEGIVIVDSTKKGTCFHLYFPQSKETLDIPDKNAPLEFEKGKGEHILVVDDEANQRDIATQILTIQGYNVDAVCSGEEAVAFCKKRNVDLIILDMLMDPGINGHQTYKQIIEICPTQKALITSGFSENSDVEATLQLGASEFIKKPYSMQQLCIAVRKELDR